jgi:DNA-binding MarR family transcriptional regulator
MQEVSASLEFFIHLAKAKTVISRRFDNRLSFHGIGFTDFVILYHLAQSPHKKMRRIDLAEKVGLTASGVTRLLLPMEKIGLVGRETNEHDARVSYVTLASGGERLLSESMEQAEALAQDLLPKNELPQSFIDLLLTLEKTVVY